jgi:HSP20 family molecular chaperone IbpA
MNDTATIEKRVGTTDQPERIRNGRTYIPAVDIIEKRDELLLLADVPGARAENIDVRYERGELTLAARSDERQPGRTEWVHREYGVGDFVRTFRIGEDIDAAKIAAEVSNGVLTITLTKHPAAKPKRITVRNA